MHFEQKFRNELSPDLHRAYDVALVHMRNFSRGFFLPGVTQDNSWTVLQAVLFDHPEIFWYDVTQFRYLVSPAGVEIQMEYVMPPDQMRMHKAALDAMLVKEFHKLRFYDEYRKVNYVHNYFMEHVVYEKDLPHDYNLFGPLFKGKGCCQGISTAFCLIMNYLDVPCFIEIGKLKGPDGVAEGHAWVAVKVLGHWTYCDPTNDLDGMRSYLCVGEKDLEGDYTIDHKSPHYDFSNRNLGYHSYNQLEFVSVDDAAKAASSKLLHSGDEFRCKFLVRDHNDHGGEFIDCLGRYLGGGISVRYMYRENMQTYVFTRI